MLRVRALAVVCSLLTVTANAQTADPVAHVFHPTPPLLSYDVATIKPSISTSAPNGSIRFPGVTMRDYIRGAYSPAGGPLPSTQVVGGPEWTDKERYVIVGKPSAQLEMQKMNTADRAQQDRTMRQSLLADRFHLKIHYEVREMPIYTLTPVKGGLKIKATVDSISPNAGEPGQRASAGTVQILAAGKSGMAIRAHAISMAQFAGFLGALGNDETSPGLINLTDGSGHPVVDQTGFKGLFDIDDLKWGSTHATTDSPSDSPSLDTALGETLGLRLIPTKGPVEVIVIDSIDHPSEN